MINCLNPRYILHVHQYLQWLGEYRRLKFENISRGLA